MKLALYLAGHLRTWSDNSAQKLLALLQGHDVDVFIATYNNIDRSDNQNMPEYKDVKFILSDEEIAAQFSKLPVREIIIDSDKVEPPVIVDRFRTGAWKMWRKVQQCNDMRIKYQEKNNIKYDYCIRHRPDTLVLQSIDFGKLPPLQTNIIVGFGATLGWPDDQFAIGSPTVMNHYCNLEKALYPESGFHKVAGFTFDVYPIHSFIQTAMVRPTKQHQREYHSDGEHPLRVVEPFGEYHMTYFHMKDFGRLDYSQV